MITIDMNKVHTDSDIGLGNHMFQYAICRLIAEKNGYNYYIPYNQYLKRCFPDIQVGIKDGESMYYFSEDSSRQDYNPNIFNCPDFTHFWGYYQSEKYFTDNEETVKSYFNVNLTTEVEEIIEKYPIDKFCYLHIRGGNLVNSTDSWLLPKSYYLDGMNKIKQQNPDISFVIVTDDYNFSKKLFPELDVLHNSVSTDFRLMYYSKYAIISNSTFAWWSSWLSDKIITIAPNNWLNYNKPSLGFYPVDVKSKKFNYI